MRGVVIKKPILIGIAGGSGAGKSTFVDMLRSRCDDMSVEVINQDHYYRDQSHLPRTDRLSVNFDHPDALDLDLMELHARTLASGGNIQRPSYDFVSHTRTKRVVEVTPDDVIIFDGIFSLYHRSLRNLLHLKVFLDVPADIRLIRRIERDTKERGRDYRSVISQYLASVRPMHLLYVEPTKAFADMAIPWEVPKNDYLDDVLQHIRRLRGGVNP